MDDTVGAACGSSKTFDVILDSGAGFMGAFLLSACTSGRVRRAAGGLIAVRILIVAATLMVATIVHADSIWSSVGPEGGDIEALLVDPWNSSTLYAATPQGVFRSTDGGRTWVSPQNNLNGLLVTSLASDPTLRGRLYAGTHGNGVFISSDGGQSWLGDPNQENTRVFSIVTDPKGSVYVAADCEVLKTTDGGITWSWTSFTDDDVTGLAIDPVTPAILYATTRASGLFKSVDGGEQWTALPLDTRSVGTLAVVSANTIYVATPAGILRSTDGGLTWVQVSPVSTGFIVDPRMPTVFYAPINGLSKSSDGGLTWTALNTTGLTTFAVHAIVSEPGPPGRLDLATDQGIFVSTDGGVWASINTGLTALPITALAINPDNSAIVYAAANWCGSQSCGGGLYRSADSALSWQIAPLSPTVLAIAPTAPETLYAASDGSSVSTTRDGGVTWSSSNIGIEIGSDPYDVFVHTLAVDPTTSVVAYAGYGYDSDRKFGIVKTTDEGLTWVPILTGETERIMGIALDPLNPAIIYAGFAGHLMKSVDAGASWTTLTLCTGVFGLDCLGGVVAVDPHAPSNVYVGYNGVFKSTDGGASWMLTMTETVGDLVIDPVTPSMLYVASTSGVQKSADAAQTWTPMNAGLPIVPNRLAIDPKEPMILYAGTNRGVYRIDQALATPSATPTSIPTSTDLVPTRTPTIAGSPTRTHASRMSADSGTCAIVEPACESAWILLVPLVALLRRPSSLIC